MKDLLDLLERCHRLWAHYNTAQDNARKARANDASTELLETLSEKALRQWAEADAQLHSWFDDTDNEYQLMEHLRVTVCLSPSQDNH